MSVSKEEILYIAKLANLKINDDEIEKYKNDINQILDYIKLLDEVDTTGVKPLSHPLEFNAKLREDVMIDSVSTEDALKNAPSHDGEYFKIPKVINQ